MKSNRKCFRDGCLIVQTGTKNNHNSKLNKVENNKLTKEEGTKIKKVIGTTKSRDIRNKIKINRKIEYKFKKMYRKRHKKIRH